MDLKRFFMGRAIGFIVVMCVALVGYWLINRPNNEPTVNPEDKISGNEEVPIAIEKVDIKETNFTGSKPAISGSAQIAIEAQKYINAQIAEFKKSADEEVPDMRDKFGADHPTANYTVDIEAKYLPGTKTDSIVLNMYFYTGGANGNSLYTVFTENNATGEILKLKDLVKKDQQLAFANLVKTSLLNWRPEESEGLVVFEDTVQELTFDMLSDFSLDDKNLTLYFDKYEVGPGALGAIAFPIPLTKVSGMLTI